MKDEDLIRFLKDLATLIAREKDVLTQMQILIRELATET